MVSRIKEILSKTSHLIRTLRLIWVATKWGMVVWGCILCIQGILPTLSVYLIKVLVDQLAVSIGEGLSKENVSIVLVPAVLMGGVLILTQVLQGVLGWVHVSQSERVQDHIKTQIHEKAAIVDLAFYEIPEKSDLLSRANSEAANRSLSILQNLGGLFQNGLTLLGMMILLIAYSVWIPLVLLLSTLPALWVVVHHNKVHHSWWEKTTESRRWTAYYDQVLTQSFPAAEVRLFDLVHYFRELYNNLRTELRTSRLRLLKSQTIANFTASLVALLVTAMTLAWMGMQALRGVATLGDIALFYQAFNQGQKIMRSLLGSVGQLYSDILFVEHLFLFLDLKPEIKSPVEPIAVPDQVQQGIHFKGVSFSYPSSSFKALNNLELYIPAGKTVALVGPNGAGKTTVTKLLCRFYDPVEGVIEMDGTDIRNYNVKELRQRCTVLFQHPMRYSARVHENIAFGDLSKKTRMDNVKTAALGGGAHDLINELPNGYETLLGKQFQGGVELSGGQWQRVTLARAFYRDSPIIILDEPTSFMDSWAEMSWLNQFQSLVKDRTTVIVTHRFTTAMRADIIFVMDKGQIVENGTHEELLEEEGVYASSWKAQTRDNYKASLDT